MCLSCTFTGILSVDYWRDLEIWVGVVQDHWTGTSGKLGYGFLFAFHSNYGHIFSRSDTRYERDRQLPSHTPSYRTQQLSRLCITSRGKSTTSRPHINATIGYVEIANCRRVRWVARLKARYMMRVNVCPSSVKCPSRAHMSKTKPDRPTVTTEHWFCCRLQIIHQMSPLGEIFCVK